MTTPTPTAATAGILGTTITPADDEWKRYEKDVTDYLASTDPGCTVEHDVKRPGELSGIPRQLDGYVHRETAGVPVEIAVECKRYTTKKIGIEYIEAFIGKVIDLGFEKGIFYSFGEVTEPARERAKMARHPKIIIRSLSLVQPARPWSEVLEEEGWLSDCPNPHCFDTIAWDEVDQDDGIAVGFGTCSSCGTVAVKCSDCGDVVDFPVGSEEKCYACGAVYELDLDHGGAGAVGVARVRHGADWP